MIGFSFAFSRLLFARRSVLLLPAACIACTGQTAEPGASGRTEMSSVRQMTDLYRQACLEDFPDRAALKHLLQADKAEPMAAGDVLKIVGGSNGEGWIVKSSAQDMQLIVQDPPYPSCAVRSIIKDGDSRERQYRSVLSHYADSKSLAPGDP